MLRVLFPIPGGLACDVPYPSQPPAFTRIGPEGAAPVAPEPAAEPQAMEIDLPALLHHLRFSPASAPRRVCPDLPRQLQYTLGQRSGTIVCNLLDDDGPPPIQAAVARVFAASIVRAIASLSQHASAARAIILFGEDAPAWLREPFAPARRLGIQTPAIPRCYPQSHPSLLLPSLLGKRLALGRLPAERGVLVLDAFAAAEIGFILQHQRGIGLVPLAIGDHVRGQSHYLLVPPGMPIGQVLTMVGAGSHDATLLGGELAAEKPVSPDLPAGQCELKLHVLPRRPAVAPAPCTRCGKCLEHCPTGAHPAGLLEAAQQRDPDIARRAGLEACILCGVCSLVCPSQLPLVRSIRTLLP